MGARLAGEAMMRWVSAPHNAFRVLLRMALTALDEPSRGMPAGFYFGGHEQLMAVIPAGENTTLASRERAARRAVDDLVAMGAIERANKARSGANAVYKLTLHNAVKPLEKKPNKRFAIDEPPVDSLPGDDGQQDTTCPAVEDTTSPAQQDTTSPESRTPDVLPRNQEEPIQEKLEEIGVDLRGPVTLARASPHPEPQCTESGCAKGYILMTEPPYFEPCPQCRPNVIQFPERKAS